MRAPHHSVSARAMAGSVHPGCCNLATEGVLALRDAELFSHDAISAAVNANKTRTSAGMPANLLLVLTSNKCACSEDLCTCSERVASRYEKKLQQLDRIADLTVPVRYFSRRELKEQEPAPSSWELREKVEAARAIQAERFAGQDITLNAQTTEEHLNHCLIDLTAVEQEVLAMDHEAVLKLVRVAQTIADLDGSSSIRKEHLARAKEMVS